MKTTILTSCCSLLLVLTAFGQTPSPTAAPVLAPTVAPVATVAPTVPPVAVVTPTVAPVATAIPTVTPAISPSATPDIDDQIDNAVEQKIRKHFNFSSDRHHSDDDDAWIALPIVFIVFLTIFGTPVMIVAVIMFFSFSRNRAMHRTVRMMVEKGQPVPESLLNPPPVIRQASDLRRGIKLMLIGLGLMIFFGACSGWDGGSWSLGIIPFLIGAGYLIFWRLDVRKDDTSPKV